MTELLSFYKFPGDEIPIICGSALSALEGTNEEIGRKAILRLMVAVDEYMPDPVRQLDTPFFMPIEYVFSIQVRYTAFLLLNFQFYVLCFIAFILLPIFFYGKFFLLLLRNY